MVIHGYKCMVIDSRVQPMYSHLITRYITTYNHV